MSKYFADVHAFLPPYSGLVRGYKQRVMAPTTTAKYTYVRGSRSTVTGTGTRNRDVAMMIAVVAVGPDGGGERGGK